MAPSASTAGQTLQKSIHKRRVEPERLAKDVPNVLIVLINDTGFGVPAAFTASESFIIGVDLTPVQSEAIESMFASQLTNDPAIQAAGLGWH